MAGKSTTKKQKQANLLFTEACKQYYYTRAGNEYLIQSGKAANKIHLYIPDEMSLQAPHILEKEAEENEIKDALKREEEEKAQRQAEQFASELLEDEMREKKLLERKLLKKQKKRAQHVAKTKQEVRESEFLISAKNLN